MKVVPCKHIKFHRKHFNGSPLEHELLNFYSTHPLTSPINLLSQQYSSLSPKYFQPLPFPRRPRQKESFFPLKFKQAQPSTTFISVNSTSILSLPGQLIQFNTVKDAIRSQLSFNRSEAFFYPKRKGIYKCSLILSLAGSTRRSNGSKFATVYLIKNSEFRVGRIRVPIGASKLKRFEIELNFGDSLSCLRRPSDVQAEILNLEMTVRK